MGIGVLGASLFHFGAADKMYARKKHDCVPTTKPWILTTLGSLAIILSVFIAFRYLPRAAQALVVADALVILLYARVLARHWVTKNAVIAFICITPILLGWLSGHRLHAGIPLAIAVVFTAIWAREILKDISDIRANEGIRVTLPMWIGIRGARIVAGALLCLSVFGLAVLSKQFFTMPAYVLAPYVLSIGLLVFSIRSLLSERLEGVEQRSIFQAICLLIVSFLGLRLYSGIM
ncbi:MAG: UbiA family prenyltransferase [bacterium]